MGKKRSKVPYTYQEPEEIFYNNSAFKLSIRKSNIIGAGKGVFTDETIPCESYIGQYCGTRLYSVEFGSYFVKLSNQPGGNMAMINDSFRSNLENNCRLVENSNQHNEPIIEVWSCREILPGQELLMSYGDDYWKNY